MFPKANTLKTAAYEPLCIYADTRNLPAPANEKEKSFSPFAKKSSICSFFLNMADTISSAVSGISTSSPTVSRCPLTLRVGFIPTLINISEAFFSTANLNISSNAIIGLLSPLLH